MLTMETLLIGLVAFLASGLTFFSGFGVGTLLMPTFALFFPVPLAIAATAVVHFVNNLFKFGLMAKRADWLVVARFSVPAALAAIGGAVLLTVFDRLPTVASYSLGDSTFEVTAVKAVIGVLIMVFAFLEWWPRFQAVTFPQRWLPLGGALSGFFGGLSGNQGALRSAFLLKAGLSKEGFVATSIVSAVIVDASRLLAYGIGFMTDQFIQSRELAAPVFVGTVCACVGSYAGMRLLQKVTYVGVRTVVAAGMLLIGLGLITGLL